jgi:hypothetical protein
MREDTGDDRESSTATAKRKGPARSAGPNPEIGDHVAFTTNTGQSTHGQVVQKIVERRQPTILLIERLEDRWRAFRLEHEVSVIPRPHNAPVRMAAPVVVGTTAD